MDQRTIDSTSRRNIASSIERSVSTRATHPDLACNATRITRRERGCRAREWSASEILAQQLTRTTKRGVSIESDAADSSIKISDRASRMRVPMQFKRVPSRSSRHNRQRRTPEASRRANVGNELLSHGIKNYWQGRGGVTRSSRGAANRHRNPSPVLTGRVVDQQSRHAPSLLLSGCRCDEIKREAMSA